MIDSTVIGISFSLPLLRTSSSFSCVASTGANTRVGCATPEPLVYVSQMCSAYEPAGSVAWTRALYSQHVWRPLVALLTSKFTFRTLQVPISSAKKASSQVDAQPSPRFIEDTDIPQGLPDLAMRVPDNRYEFMRAASSRRRHSVPAVRTSGPP
eukprot:scaffold3019_cov69-Phaeocystis_antarctica.AAC.2